MEGDYDLMRRLRKLGCFFVSMKILRGILALCKLTLNVSFSSQKILKNSSVNRVYDKALNSAFSKGLLSTKQVSDMFYN